MSGLGAQLRTLRGRLHRHATKPQEYLSTQTECQEASSPESSEIVAKPQLEEKPDSATLRLVAIAGVFGLTSSDLLAFPEAAHNFRMKLLGFSFQDAVSSHRDDDTC